ncbi:MAG TPA: hypothetical protein VMG60_13200 [Burkholderiaceae bacterium]|nr:hypothetical protein [Burkholderiaceae bacterium]
MRPASRRALLRRVAAAARPARGGWAWALALVVLGVIGVARWVGPGEAGPPAPQPVQQSAPLLVGALASPFGEGSARAAPAQEPDGGRIEALREAYRRAGDLQVLYVQWRERPEADARYLAFRAARDCDLLRAGIVPEVDVLSERRGEHERQMMRAGARCRGFQTTPAPPDEVQRLEQEAAAAGSPAAQIALIADSYAQHPLAETVSTLRKGLASRDPLAFDEARVLLAISRHQLEIAGVAPTVLGDLRVIDARVVAIDLVGCRLGNPCGPGRGMLAIDCDGNAPCERDAEEWLIQLAGLGEDERRSAEGLAERMFAAFGRGAVDEIVRLPAGAQAMQ